MGLLLTVALYAANHHDSEAAFKVMELLKHRFPRLVKIIADAGYRGQSAENIKASFGRILQVVIRRETLKFAVLPQRWIVERTFHGLNLIADYRKALNIICIPNTQ